jgi:type IV pilus assembly protein PilE
MEKMRVARSERTPAKTRGFTLIELMITIAVVALLVALALPGYQQFIRKSNRGEAQQLMMNYANLEEIWRANNNTYADETGITLPTHDKYAFYIRNAGSTCANADPTGNAYVVVACAQGNQANDKDQGTTCTPLTLDQSNAKTPAVCW